MHFRRLACLILGAWLAGNLFMAMVATENFHAVDRLLQNPSPQASAQIAKLGSDPARLFLRYQVSEQNRWYFHNWEIVQIFLGALLLLTLLFGTTESKWWLGVALAMFGIVIAVHVALTPAIVRLGRMLDFLPPDIGTPVRSRFWALHGAYSGFEILKFLMASALALKMILPGKRRSARNAALSLPGLTDRSRL